jgi:hypothetical protein
MTRRAVCFAVLVGLALPVGLTSVVRAEPPSAAAVADAGKHFQRGVTMYNEADYRAALVEFRRAYEIAPNAAVLYNIGQTYYQLQNYAAALVALGRYLTESGSGAAHRREVEATIDTLQTRVGKVAVSSNVPGCDITVDDELIGKTPLDEPVLVSIGRRKITALRDGRVTETRFVDVAAGDTVNVSLAAGDASHGQASPSAPAHHGVTKGTITGLWITTAALGAVTLGTGTVAFFASRDLKDAREHSYPIAANDLSSKSSKVKTFSLIADLAGVATLATAGVTLYLSMSRPKESETGTHVSLTPNGIQIAGTFR